MLKPVLTLGPASADPSIIARLIEVADRFRLNASHLTEADLNHWLAKLSTVFRDANRSAPVVLDLQGAKMRIGNYPRTGKLPDQVLLALSADSSSPETIPVPHETFFTSIRPGDVITLNDARITLKVRTVSRDRAEARVLRNGPLSPSKGINRQVHPIPYLELSPGDRRMIELTRDCPFIEYAFSFVHDGNEAGLLRPRTGGKRLVAKIERPEAFPSLSRIDAQFDELWLCRGDLGAQAGLANLGALQAEFAAHIPRFTHPAYLAGQVLEHMTHFPDPTRSEVVHLHDVEKAGFAGIVLSDETAIGKNPGAVAEFLKQIREQVRT